MKTSKLLIVSLSVASFLTTTTVIAQNSKKTKDTKKITQVVNTKKSEIETMRTAAYNKYLKAVKTEKQFAKDLADKQITFDGATMKFEYFKIGEKPKKGYPLFIAMHGGGATPLNNSQWEHMKRYYRDSVKSGIYVATLGVRQTWNTHFNPESYALYDRLIETLCVEEGVDMNQVYILGFSAGGDGAYNLGPNMADRWAAVGMSAGHPNGVSPINLYNTPFLMQMGEFDSAFKRNKEVAMFNQKLNKLQKEYNGGFIHDCFIHKQRGHNFPDNDSKMSNYEIIKNPDTWLADGDRTSIQQNTNSIAWLTKYKRNPYPQRVLWNTTTLGERRNGVAGNGDKMFLTERPNQFYWLSIGNNNSSTLGTEFIDASYNKENNKIIITGAKTYLKILLNDKMVDFNKKITIKINKQELTCEVKPNQEVMYNTLISRGDINYMFDAEVILEEQDGKWKIK